MILIGQYDSSFVRRIGIALTLYEIGFEHRPWSTFSDVEKLRDYNPLTRVPTLVLQNGDVLIETSAIIDYIDGLVPAERRLFPAEQPGRYRAMRISALASGIADLSVRLFYERFLHRTISDVLVSRVNMQLKSTLDALESECVGLASPYWFGDRIGHADIAVTASIRHMNDSNPGLMDRLEHPALSAYTERLEALPVFREISQPFIAPV
jgi:glutathione S-transferase